jgi:hypothetical protein
VANVHLHHLTAKKEHGFDNAHKTFWCVLATYIKKYNIRVLAGDFNMSLLCVVPELRRRQITVNIAAIFPWNCIAENMKADSTRFKLDSCGVFIIGEASSIKLMSCPSVFGDPVADEEGQQVLRKFDHGQGYALGSYLPKGPKGPNGKPSTVVETQMEAVKETFTFKTTVQGLLFPPCNEKWVDSCIFDPTQTIYSMGVHMPLLVFIGNRPRRSATRLEAREQRARDRGMHFGIGRRMGGSGGWQGRGWEGQWDQERASYWQQNYWY